MTSHATPTNDEIDELRNSLLRGLRVDLRPDQGDEAFERHQLLAIRFHRAARLNLPKIPENGKVWRCFFDEHFPRGGRYARKLWTDWRVALLKDETPGVGVVISHGQPQPHWRLVGPDKELYINLESMWDDFERSIGSMTEMLRRDAGRRTDTLAAWQARQWTVKQYELGVPKPINMVASAVHSATGMGP